jgi:hypothetical protein
MPLPLLFVHTKTPKHQSWHQPRKRDDTALGKRQIEAKTKSTKTDIVWCCDTQEALTEQAATHVTCKLPASVYHVRNLPRVGHHAESKAGRGQILAKGGRQRRPKRMQPEGRGPMPPTPGTPQNGGIGWAHLGPRTPKVVEVKMVVKWVWHPAFPWGVRTPP